MRYSTDPNSRPRAAHPDIASIRAARANTERLEAIVPVMPKGVCSWCGFTYRDGPEPISHGVCDDPDCQKLQAEPLYPWRVRSLALEMALAEPGPEFRRASERHRRAHEKMVEDYEREIRRLRVAAAETTNPNGDSE